MALEADQIAQALPGYDVGAELGRGAWGQVLAGHHRSLKRDVAIKQLPRAFAADSAVRGRFVSEGRLLASLDHPHIVPVFDFVEQDGLCLLVMELLPRGTVWDRFTSQGFTPTAACATILAAAAGLHAAHAKNVLHRDVKPENLMFSADGVLKVTDFGIAKVVGGDSTLATRAGEVVGTPAYIAPEQARGGALTPATDVYALATMLYELLSGQLPFPDDGDAMALLFKHAYEEPAPLSQKAPSVPAPIAPVVMRGLATAAADRFTSAESFALALAEACTSVWGPGWLAAEGVPVMGAANVVAATERLTFADGAAPIRAAAVAAPSAGPIPPPPPGAAALAGPGGGPNPTVVRQQATPQLQQARSTVIRATSPAHSGSAGITDLGATAVADLVPVQRVVKSPPRAIVPVTVAIIAFAVAVVLAVVGIGSSPLLGRAVGTGTVAVGGLNVSTGPPVPINFSEPVKVQVRGGPPAARARLSVVVIGYRALSSTAAVVAGPGGTATATVDMSTAHYLVGGRLTAEVDLLGKGAQAGTVVSSWRFAVRAAQSPWLTVAGIAVVALGLFSLAYIEQFGRALWRGRRRVSSTIGLGPSAALLAVVAVGVAWLTGTRQPTLATVIACAAVGMVSGLALAAGAARGGRGRRMRRRAARSAAANPAPGSRRAA